VALAVGAVKRWAAGEGHVTAKTRAKAAEAVAHWEALKAASHARADDDEDEQDWLEELAEQEAEMEDADSPGAVIPGNVRFDTRTGPKGYSHGWIKSAAEPGKGFVSNTGAPQVLIVGVKKPDGTWKYAATDPLPYAQASKQLSQLQGHLKEGKQVAIMRDQDDPSWKAMVAEQPASRDDLPLCTRYWQFRDVDFTTISLPFEERAELETGTSSVLLPVGPSLKQSESITESMEAISRHRFAGTDLMKCAKCGKPITDVAHRTLGQRHAGPDHEPVPTGHIAGKQSRHIQAARATYDSALAKVEPGIEAAMNTIFERQRQGTISRLTGKRGKSMLRAATPPTPPPGEEPPPVSPSINPAAIFDPTFWSTATAEALTPAMGAVGGIASDRVLHQIGSPSINDGTALAAVNQVLAKRAQESADKVTATTRQAIFKTLQAGVANGEAMPELAKRVNAVFAATPARAKTIAQTEVVGAMNEAAHIYANNLPPGMVGSKIWLSHHDDRTRPHHVLADGQEVPVSSPFFVGGYAMQFPGDPVAPPSEVINCFPADTPVDAPGVLATSRRWYMGDMVRLHTRSGTTIRCTPNHPILTLYGWKPAKALAEGDQLVEARLFEDASVCHPEVNDMPPSFGQLVDALEDGGTRRRMVVQPKDFHCDGMSASRPDGEINVVGANSPLGRHNQFALAQVRRYLSLSETYLPRLSLESFSATSRADSDGGITISLSTSGRLSIPSQPLTLIKRGLTHADIHRLGSPTPRGVGFPQDAADYGTVDPVPVGQSLLALASQIGLDDVVGVEVESFVGHVLNLQTPVGWYTVAGLVAHNCRCGTGYLPPGMSLKVLTSAKNLDGLIPVASQAALAKLPYATA